MPPATIETRPRVAVPTDVTVTVSVGSEVTPLTTGAL